MTLKQCLNRGLKPCFKQVKHRFLDVYTLISFCNRGRDLYLLYLVRSLKLQSWLDVSSVGRAVVKSTRVRGSIPLHPSTFSGDPRSGMISCSRQKPGIIFGLFYFIRFIRILIFTIARALILILGISISS